jgi:hypothetical protein
VSPSPAASSARRRHAGARDSKARARTTCGCSAPDPEEDLGKRSFLPNANSPVSCRIGACVDVVSRRRNDFLVLRSLSSLIVAPRQKKVVLFITVNVNRNRSECPIGTALTLECKLTYVRRVSVFRNNTIKFVQTGESQIPSTFLILKSKCRLPQLVWNIL